MLRGKYAYVGMIGSKTKVAAVRKALEEAGFSREILDGVDAPIGLPIGGQTPAEIAVSIAARLVQVRAALGPGVTKPPEGPGVLCTIVEKHGSAPRGVGAWMLVRPDGTCAGTIGGGAVEHQVKQDALALWAPGRRGGREGVRSVPRRRGAGHGVRRPGEGPPPVPGEIE